MTNSLYDALFAPHEGSDRPFLTLDDGLSISYGDFVARGAQMAHVLVSCGVGPGDRVLVQAPKLADTLALYAGTVQAGAVYLPLNPAYTEAELAYFVENAEPKLIVCDAAQEKEWQSLSRGTQSSVVTLSAAGGTLSDRADAMPRSFATVPRKDADLAALLYTSGTTGRSKGAMLSHRNLLSNARTLTELWHITNADRLLHALPIFHTHGLFVALNTALLAGAEVRLLKQFDVDLLLEELPGGTLLMGVPTFYTRLLAAPRFTRDLTSAMRLFISGSAPLLADTHAEFEARTGHRILERYGMTETNMITSNPYDGDRRAGTVGYPLPNVEVRITDLEENKEVPAGEIGVIEVRGDNVFQGYWKMPEKTSEELRPDGFFITGDLAKSETDGRISIVGRVKDLIIAGGFNIYPKEVEDVLNGIDGISESAVYGVAHPDFGESVVAALVPEADKVPDIEAIEAAVQKALARYKHPRAYRVLTELPRNAMGKVQKNLLRDQDPGLQ
ncbi:MAG: malonyl-CoA synthase [Pseudomonadota bacterium]